MYVLPVMCYLDGKSLPAFSRVGGLHCDEESFLKL